MLTATPPLPVVAMIPVLNCPNVETLVALTCTEPVVAVGDTLPWRFVLVSVSSPLV